jgi:hypothetical protein
VVSRTLDFVYDDFHAYASQFSFMTERGVISDLTDDLDQAAVSCHVTLKLIAVGNSADDCGERAECGHVGDINRLAYLPSHLSRSRRARMDAEVGVDSILHGYRPFLAASHQTRSNTRRMDSSS